MCLVKPSAEDSGDKCVAGPFGHVFLLYEKHTPTWAFQSNLLCTFFVFTEKKIAALLTPRQ